MLRTVHILKNTGVQPPGPRYVAVDTARNGEDAGFAPQTQLSSRDEVAAWLIKEGLGFSQVEAELRKLEEQGSVDIQLSPRLGPRIVRAWFDTVVNPLLQSLELEVTLIEKRNWTWTFRPAGFELIRPVKRYIDYQTWANLDQMIELMPNIATAIKTHDESVAALLHAATSLGEALLLSPEFNRLCQSLLSSAELQRIGVSDRSELFGAYPPEEHLQLLAQHVINNSGEQPSYYATSKLWNKHREKLLGSLKLDGICQPYNDLLESATMMKSGSEFLAHLLQTLRLDLSMSFDVPYVPSLALTI
jgi:hypothetical protein